MWWRVRLIVGRGGTCGTHTQPRLALNLFVRELSKRHDSCECTISSLLERAPPCHVQWAGWSAILFLFWFYLFFFFFTILWLFLGSWSTGWISLCALFSSFWPWKLVALTSPVYDIRQLPRSIRAKPHLPDARFMPIRTASICVYACVYIDIYIKREKYLWIYFFPILWRELLIRNKQRRSLFFGGTLPCYSEGKCLFSWK